MNFDFNTQELELFTEIDGLMEPFCANRALESRDGTIQQIREAQAILAKTDYLKLGLEKTADFGDSTASTLMGARERIAAWSPSLYLSVEMSTRLFGSIIVNWGDNRQREWFLPPLTNGKIIGGVGLSEKSMNIDNDPWQTEGVVKDDAISITGRKSFVINSLFADWLAIGGQFEGQPAFFLVKSDTENLVFGERVVTAGFQGCPIADVTLDRCIIPREQMIVTDRKGTLIDQVRKWENQILIGAALGLMKSSYESARDYAKKHHTGGKPIIAYQEVAFKLAEMLTLYQTSQLLAQRSAWSDDHAPDESVELAHCAKVFCSESAEKVSSAALQILGRSGYITGHPTECAYRCAKYTQIAGTSTEIARVKIGDQALGIRG